MRVLLDANLFVSYLLAPERESPSARIIRAALLGKFTLLLPEALLDELVRAVERKPYLRERIRPEEMAQLADILKSVAKIIPRITEPIPAVTRDPKDDYLIAYALVGEADYLVTGDKDLLVLEGVGTLRILTPRAFLGMLNERCGDRV